jgi:hypothetical protein
VKAAKILSNKQTVHDRQLERFDVRNIRGEGKLVAPVSADDKDIRYYLFYESLFSLIHEIHLAVSQESRTRMLKELS